MNYRIYQIPLNEENRDYVFEHRETLEKKGMYPPPRSLYKLVYEGECEMISPVAVFQLHNQDDRPARKSIRSMSTSDIFVFEHTSRCALSHPEHARPPENRPWANGLLFAWAALKAFHHLFNLRLCNAFPIRHRQYPNKQPSILSSTSSISARPVREKS